jgi:hypothetical protein
VRLADLKKSAQALSARSLKIRLDEDEGAANLGQEKDVRPHYWAADDNPQRRCSNRNFATLAADFMRRIAEAGSPSAVQPYDELR